MVQKIPLTMTKYDLLIKSNYNVFNVDDLVAIWASSNRRDVLESIKGYINREKVFNIFKGVYVLDKNYNKFELAQKLYTPSYITYYSALAVHGIIFQKYSDIHLFASNSKKIVVDGQKYIFHKMKTKVLMNQKGLDVIDNYTLASPERSICDSLYLNKRLTFDNLRNIKKEKLQEISRIYNNKRLEKDILQLLK